MNFANVWPVVLRSGVLVLGEVLEPDSGNVSLRGWFNDRGVRFARYAEPWGRRFMSRCYQGATSYGGMYYAIFHGISGFGLLEGRFVVGIVDLVQTAPGWNSTEKRRVACFRFRSMLNGYQAAFITEKFHGLDTMQRSSF